MFIFSVGGVTRGAERKWLLLYLTNSLSKYKCLSLKSHFYQTKQVCANCSEWQINILIDMCVRRGCLFFFKPLKLHARVCVRACVCVRVCVFGCVRTERWAICSSSLVGEHFHRKKKKKLRVPNSLPISDTYHTWTHAHTHTHTHTHTPYWPHPGDAVLPELIHYVTRLSRELLNGHADRGMEMKKSRAGQEEDTERERERESLHSVKMN